MRPTDRFGGHFVSGHVDGLGTIVEKMALPGETRLKIKTPPELAQLMVMKGSVAVDGISLTIAGLEKQAFEVSLIPHTLKATTIQYKGPGASVNIECDMIGKWVRKFLSPEGATKPREGQLTLEKLQEEGF
jgi:riboflavin synthase